MPFRVDAALIRWISTDAELASAAAQWRAGGGQLSNPGFESSALAEAPLVLGIDSEFQRTDTFYPLPGLYQVYDGHSVYLIDPLAIDNWEPFASLLSDPEVVIVMHACSEDLELFFTHLNIVPSNLFDTQLAYAFLHPNFSISYANIVEQYAGELLDKGQTRSNWLRRPLSDAQLQYAAADVVHLPQLHQQLSATLQAKQRADWFAEEMSRLAYQPPQPHLHYRQVKGAQRLAEDALQRLQQLCAWRETQAMSKDVPRNRIVRDEHLLAFAQQPQLSQNKVRELLPPGVAKRFGPALLEVHAATSSTAIEPLPESLTPAQGKVVTALREAGKEVAERLVMAPELLARKREVEQSLRHYLNQGQHHALYQGWRQPLLGSAFAQVLAQADVRAPN